jgi:hypothetical protein
VRHCVSGRLNEPVAPLSEKDMILSVVAKWLRNFVVNLGLAGGGQEVLLSASKESVTRLKICLSEVRRVVVALAEAVGETEEISGSPNKRIPRQVDPVQLRYCCPRLEIGRVISRHEK